MSNKVAMMAEFTRELKITVKPTGGQIPSNCECGGVLDHHTSDTMRCRDCGKESNVEELIKARQEEKEKVSATYVRHND